ncbi:MAG: uronate dehydrogenase [Pseudonocardiales bacterium]|nr:uronate dehydrogenase [Pseudonocardiales bacterium]
MKVLLTGSSGQVGRMLSARLPALGFEVREFDRVNGQDVNDPAALDTALVDVEAVVHLAGQPTEAPWPVIREANIDGAFSVFEGARRAGIGRVVFASSNHAVGFTPNCDDELDAATPPRPDTLYGVSKVFGEALGRYYADRYGMQVACLRIGSCSEHPRDGRSLATWLSPDDCARLIQACLRSADLTYALIWGVSANRYRWWSLAAGAEVGYRPLDDAAITRPDLAVEDRRDIDAVVGGEYTGASYGIDEVLRASEGDRT